MKKRIRKIIGAICIVMALVVTQIPAMNVSATNPDYQLDGDVLVKYTGSGDVIEIPASVKIIGDEAFADHDNIETIVLNDNIREIRYQAFYDCDRLQSVVIPDSCKVIGNGAFADCDALKDVYIGSAVEDFGTGVFAGDRNLTNLTLSENNANLQLANGAIYNRDATHMYEYLSSNTAHSFQMPDTVESIGKFAFWGCDALNYVELSGKLEAIPAYSFSNCRNLQMLTVPFSSTMIGAKAFENCIGLKAIEIPDSVRSIHETAFDGCSGVQILAGEYSPAGKYAKAHKMDAISQIDYQQLQSGLLLRIENGTIEEEAVTSENTITPDNTTTTVNNTNNTQADGIDSNGLNPSDAPSNPGEPTGNQTNTSDNSANALNGQAVQDNGKYQQIIIDPDISTVEQPYGAKQEISPENDSDSNLGNVQDASNQGDINSQSMLQSTIVTDNAMVFVDNTTQKVYMGGVDSPLSYEDVLESIQENNEEASVDISNEYPELVIGSASDEKGLYIPKYTVFNDKIAGHAFYGNTDLVSFDFPSGISEIGDFAFARSGLKEITIPDSVSKIGMGAFYHCGDLERISIPSSIETIESYAFDSTKWMQDFLQRKTGDSDYLIVGDGILLAYRGNAAKVEIPYGVKTIGPRAFADHQEIVSVVIPANVRSIDTEAFMGCNGLSSVILSSGLEEIHDRAFSGCPLTYIKIPDTVKSMGVSCFDKTGTVQENNDAVIEFTSMLLPVTTYDMESTRYYQKESRNLSLPTTIYAIVPNETVILDKTILDPYESGFRGFIFAWKSPESVGQTVDENSNASSTDSVSGGNSVNRMYLTLLKSTLEKDLEEIVVPDSISLNSSTALVNGTSEASMSYYDSLDWRIPVSEENRINLRVHSALIKDLPGTNAAIPGNTETLYIDLSDSDSARSNILEAYNKMYTNSNVFSMSGFDIEMYDSYDIAIHELGANKLILSLAAPENMQEGLMYVLTLDNEGQLETVPSRFYTGESGSRMIEFEVNHLSDYAFICFDTEYSDKMMGKLDNSPDTGDISGTVMKWVLFAGLLSLGAFLILFRSDIGKRKQYKAK